MIQTAEPAYAKLNLTLDVLDRRPDGYHNMRMLMASSSLCDTVRITLGTGAPWRLVCEVDGVPLDRTNLAWRAAEAFFRTAGLASGGLTIIIEKRIPFCAGLAGGSSDAAAVLRGLNRVCGAPLSGEALLETAASIGSDVPYCLLGGTALAEGRGEHLTSLRAAPACFVVLCKPDFPISTPALFAALDRTEITRRPDTALAQKAISNGTLPALADCLYNVFEPLVEARHPELREIRAALLKSGALGAAMSGSGPTMFGLFRTKTEADDAFCRLKSRYTQTFLETLI